MPFYTNKRVELVKSPKVYFFDLGFRNICLDNFSKGRTDIGSMYENFIFSEMIKNNTNVKFWNTKSKAEVDFIIEKQNKIIPIEIKSTLNNTLITKSYHSFIDKYKIKEGYILSLNFEGKKETNDQKIIFLPFVKFLNIPKKSI